MEMLCLKWLACFVSILMVFATVYVFVQLIIPACWWTAISIKDKTKSMFRSVVGSR